MRHLFLSGSLILLIASAQAEEVAPPASGPVHAGSADASVDVGTYRPAPQVERMSGTGMAAKEIDLLRRTINETVRSKSFFGLFSSPAAPIDGELLQEADRFIQRHAGQPETAEVYHLKAQVHYRMENYPAAALDWLMLRVVYPDSPFAVEAEKRLTGLGGDQLKKQAALLDEMVRWTKSLGGGRDYRVATWLGTVAGKSNDPGFAAPIVAECAAFLMDNREYHNEDDIEYALARQALLVDSQIGIYHFDKLLALYPDSPFRPGSLLSIANTQRQKQHVYDRAVQTYSRLIEQHPDTAEAAQGYEMLAEMYDQDMRDYPNAIKIYETIIAKFRDTTIVLRALNNMASIYQNRTNQPAKAVDSYLRIAGVFRGPEVLDALNKAEKIARYTMHDWNSALAINDRIVAHSPDSEDAAKAMFANAEIVEEQLGDKRQARALYEKLIAARPGHPLAKEARQRIAAMDRS